MKLFAILLLAALVGSSIATPRQRYGYRMSEESDESQEVELEADEVEVEIPQDDDVSEEDDDPPPKFHELFPTPSKAGVPSHGPQNMAFANMLHEIEENGWKRPKGVQNQQQRRQRTSLKPVFRADDDDSDEDEEQDEEEDDAEDDEPFAPDFDTMFPNPEGKPSGPQNIPQYDFGSPASLGNSNPESVRFRSIDVAQSPATGKTQSGQQPVYYVSSGSSRPSGRPQRDRAPMTPVRGFMYRQPTGNRRVSQYPMSYRPQQQVSYRPQQQVSYRPQQQVYRPQQQVYRPQQQVYRPQQQVSYRPQLEVSYRPQLQVSYRPQQQYRLPYYHQKPTGQVYYVQRQPQRPQYYQTNNRRNYVPMVYARQPARQNYVQRMRSNFNNRYWN